ncbi:MAG: thymidine kinase, partial [Anaerolineae bacterium]
FKPALDTRYGEGEVTSHNGLGFEALRVERPTQILEALQPDTTVVAIDEVQFFGDAIGHVCQTLAERGVRVIVTGLDLDFRGEPFGPVPLVMAQAERVDKLHAICVVCGDDASRSQRLINGKPARYDDPVILVGATEVYEARCRTHHEVVARPVREERAEGPPP